MEPGVVFNAAPATLADLHFPESSSGQLFNLIKVGNYAEGLQADELHLTGSMDPSEPIEAGSADVYIYVRTGSGTLHISAPNISPTSENLDITEGTAVHIRSQETFYLHGASALELIMVRVPDASGPYARKQLHPSSRFTRSVQQGLSAAGSATGNREYEVLFDADSGSSGATMFVGFIPPSGAPAHYHLYDEICQIVKGSGQLQTGSTFQPLSVGSTFSIVPRFLHSVINDTSENLWILGTFRPEGSPAAAYYPDGRPAPGYEEQD
jgi:mannose-6-phosphate isomerase-like protein (cupin superfamily)